MASTTTLESLLDAQRVLASFPDVVRTPIVNINAKDVHITGNGGRPQKLALKLESLQTTGSFKIRGMRYKIAMSSAATLAEKGIVTMSAGNAGKAVSYLSSKIGCAARVFMPDTAPEERRRVMESFGASVVPTPGTQLLARVEDFVKTTGAVFVHPFDDVDIIRGHASCGLEILEDVPEVDVVVVCCGGGGLLAGVAAAIKLKAGASTRVVGVEPEGANSMWLSVKAGSAQWCPDGGKTSTIAHGLAPPFAGKVCYEHVNRFVDEVVLVSDDEMRRATAALFARGIVAEISGAAALAAVMAGKCGELTGKTVCCTVSGRNISIGELHEELSSE